MVLLELLVELAMQLTILAARATAALLMFFFALWSRFIERHTSSESADSEQK